VTELTVTDMMAAYAQDATEHAKATCGIALDYTPASVEHVEEVLGRLYEAIPRGLVARLFKKAPSADEIATVSKMYGGYIGECIRRTWGGEWEVDHPVAGPRSFPISSGGHQSFPLGWCFKRLRNGPEDNVWHKMQILYLKRDGEAAEQRDEADEARDA
jgi:hypothetical protein